MTIAHPTTDIARDFGLFKGISFEDGIKRDYPTLLNIIEVEEKSGSNLTDFQILLDKDVNENDRFSSVQGKDCAFWREAADKCWIKIDSLPANSKRRIFGWKNDAASSASNGEATFEFFDDFTGTLTDKWSGDTSYFSYSNGELVMSNSNSVDKFIYSKTGFGVNPVTLETKFRRVDIPSTNNGAEVGIGKGELTDTWRGEIILYSLGGSNPLWCYRIRSEDGTIDDISEAASVGTTYRGKTKIASGKQEIYRDDVLKNDNTFSAFTWSLYAKCHTFRGNLNLVSFLFVRKYASPEQTVSIVAS